MTDYIRPLLRMFILFALVFTVVVLAKPTPASALLTCCQECTASEQACLSFCTTPACRLSCEKELTPCERTCEGLCKLN
jgi:hypothetical protein